MKKFLIFILTIAILGVAGASYYYWWKPSQVNLWTFVPDTSIAVFEPVNIQELIAGDENRKILKNLKSHPSFQQVASDFGQLDSIGLKLDGEGDLFAKTKILISVHKSNKSALALTNLYLVEVKNLKHHSYFGDVVSWMQKHGFKKTERLYQGYKINEFSKGETTFAYIFYNNFLIASFSPFLVDDAIRMIEKGRANGFLENEDLALAMQQNLIGEGRLYINSRQMAGLATRLLISQAMNLASLEWFSSFMHLDISVQNDRIDLSGFSILDTASTNYLSAYLGIRGLGFEMKNVIPDHASTVLHVSFDDPRKWQEGLKSYWRKHKASHLSEIGELENKYGFDREAFYSLVDHEVGMFLLDTKKSFVREKILCIKHSDHILAERVLNDLAKSVTLKKDISMETYSGRRVGFIKVEEIPARLFGEVFSGFSEAYYFVNRNFIFVANSQHALHVLIDDIDSENTWRKSIKTNKFLETTNDDANFSVYTKGAGFWKMAEDNLSNDWGESIKENELIFNQIEYAAIQFTNVDDNFYTNITLQHPGNLLELQQPKSFQTKASIDFGQRLISKPFAVRNHKNKSLEMMVQDSSFNLHLITSDNKKALKIPLKSKLVTPVYQVDYYKNGKLQYLFGLNHSIHMIDRTGTYIPGYPVNVKSDQPIKYISLIDYDGSKDYRILVATQKSFYYLHNKVGKKLKGWNPKKLTGSPMMPGTHIRVRKSDFMMFLQDNGIVHGLNRQGIGKSGFPIDLKGNISSPLHIKKGGTLASTDMIAVTDQGELIEFNLLGGVIRRDQFLKESVNDKFKLVNSNNGNQFIVTKENDNRIYFFNENLEELFEVPVYSSDYEIQYYYFDSLNELVVVVDRQNKLTYLYDMKGRLMHLEPLDSGELLAMLYHENGEYYEIYCISKKTLKIVTIER